eukprot:1157093-Pelagomonas_calceolata.AAC.5
MACGELVNSSLDGLSHHVALLRCWVNTPAHNFKRPGKEEGSRGESTCMDVSAIILHSGSCVSTWP